MIERPAIYLCILAYGNVLVVSLNERVSLQFDLVSGCAFNGSGSSAINGHPSPCSSGVIILTLSF